MRTVIERAPQDPIPPSEMKEGVLYEIKHEPFEGVLVLCVGAVVLRFDSSLPACAMPFSSFATTDYALVPFPGRLILTNEPA